MGAIRQQALDDAWRAAYAADPLPDFPVADGNMQAFIYGKHCAVAAIKALASCKTASAGASKGGLARMAKLSPEQRSEIARMAAAARWAKRSEVR